MAKDGHFGKGETVKSISSITAYKCVGLSIFSVLKALELLKSATTSEHKERKEQLKENLQFF